MKNLLAKTLFISLLLLASGEKQLLANNILKLKHVVGLVETLPVILALATEGIKLETAVQTRSETKEGRIQKDFFLNIRKKFDKAEALKTVKVMAPAAVIAVGTLGLLGYNIEAGSFATKAGNLIALSQTQTCIKYLKSGIVAEIGAMGGGAIGAGAIKAGIRGGETIEVGRIAGMIVGLGAALPFIDKYMDIYDPVKLSNFMAKKRGYFKLYWEHIAKINKDFTKGYPKLFNNL